jgi:hypothetical protein
MSRFAITHKIAVAAMLLSVSAGRALAAGPYSIEQVKISSSLPKSITSDVDPSGVLLFTSGKGVKEEICSIFLAKSAVAAVPPPANSGYSSIREGALIGIVHLFREATDDYYVDYNNQKLAPGYYTMRYALQTSGVGEHGPIQGDFVVLSPIAMDSEPERVLSLEEVVRLGKSASHGEEAARMQLMRVEDTKSPLPAVTADSSGAAVVHLNLHLAGSKTTPAKELQIDLTVVTPKPDLGQNAS